MVDGAVRRREEPGSPEWDVVVGSRFIAAVAAPAPDRVLTRLAECAGLDPLELEELVAGIPMGAGGVEHFALVWWPESGDPITAIVRGDAVIDLASPGGARRLDSRGITPWHLAEFTAVTRLRIAGAASPLDEVRQAGLRGTPVPAGRASFRASAVEWSWRDAPARPGSRAGDPDVDTRLARPSRATRERRGPMSGVPTAPMQVVDDDTVRFVRGNAADADTVLTSTARAQLADRREADGQADAPAADARVPAERGQPTLRYRVVGGEVGEVSVPVLIGRSPSAPRMSAGEVALVRVHSPAGVVSATHLELRMEGGRLVAADLRSTNGTVVRTSAGQRRLRSGESLVVTPGTSLQLGGDTIVEILPALGSVDA
ncbi:FHA domain-containing protein [Agromyces kandeliae]|uniref:FHA domain-containing protein n=1 Tax=Agromyces kandeliae TaxID=2666141 RepID=A0A6L5QYD9_9MICO|nr:FHA domain-containing protein [Agromyces kandeliae]MRX42781.1 FHA domain-containing protein [Agromyces kandeliae]